MDREMKRKYLIQAARHVAEGEDHIIRQRMIVAQYEREGWDATLSRRLLRSFEATQAIHVADYQRLLDELTLSS